MTRLLGQVGGLDVNFLAIEDADNHMHIGSVGSFAGPAPSYDELSNLIGSKLAQVPRYRQKVRTAVRAGERALQLVHGTRSLKCVYSGEILECVDGRRLVTVAGRAS